MPNQSSDIDKELEKAELELSQPEPEETPPAEETPEEEPKKVEEEKTTDTTQETAEETEESEEPTDTEEETAEPHPYDKQFADRGLGSQFRDVSDLISRESDRTQYIGSQERRIREQAEEIEEYRKRNQTPKRELTPEEEESVGFMDERYVGRDDATSSDKRITALEEQAGLDQVAIATLEIPELKNVASALRSGSNPVRGYNKHWDAMQDAFNSNAALKGLRGPGAVKVLFDLTKNSVEPKKKPPVKKLSAERKASASTNSGGKVSKELKPSPDGEYPGWGSTAEDIEKALNKRTA